VLAVVGFGEEFAVVATQGTELAGLESVLSQTVPPEGKVLVVTSGSDGNRIRDIAKVSFDLVFFNLSQYYGEVVEVSFADNEPVSVDKIRSALSSNPGITNVAMVHCETSTGAVLPWKELADLVRIKLAVTPPLTLVGQISSPRNTTHTLSRCQQHLRCS
jgi:2-aminoethylphosphonate-pyruvate transaminase